MEVVHAFTLPLLYLVNPVPSLLVIEIRFFVSELVNDLLLFLLEGVSDVIDSSFKLILSCLSLQFILLFLSNQTLQVCLLATFDYSSRRKSETTA